MIWNNAAQCYVASVYFEAARDYYEIHGNLFCKCDYINDAGIPLGRWLSEQRKKVRRGLLIKEVEHWLSSIDPNWEANSKSERQWLERYYDACVFKRENGHMRIPEKYVTKDGMNLGRWIVKQRREKAQGKLSDRRVELLESIGMDWRTERQAAWDEMYNLVKEYAEKTGDINAIPRNIEGNNGKDLRRWVMAQKQKNHKGILPNREKTLLEDIGIMWDREYIEKRREKQWQQMYEYAKEYAAKTGNINNIDSRYKTSEGTNLGYWIKYQKTAKEGGRLSSKKQKKLEILGIIW